MAIKKSLRDKAREYWFAGTSERCSICCTSTSGNTHYHHCWINGQNPYEEDYEDHEILLPVCDVCHGKLESDTNSPLHELARYLVKKKKELYEGSLEKYIDTQLSFFKQYYKIPLGNEDKHFKNVDIIGLLREHINSLEKELNTFGELLEEIRK